MAGKLKIALGADHGGFALKEGIKAYLKAKGHEVLDFGTNSEASCDYPEFGSKAAKAVGEKKADYGIVICRSGFGMCIVANKIRTVRCATCDAPGEAETARKHNDCNVLSLGANRVSLDEAIKITDIFISTKAEGDRHQRRVEQIKSLETKK